MGGSHSATQYYLGTAQLDAGIFADGVRNVAAALQQDPDNFGPEAVQRLKSGRQSVDMACEKRASCGAGEVGPEGVGVDAPLVSVWDDAVSGDLLQVAAAAGSALQREQHKAEAPRTLWLSKEAITDAGAAWQAAGAAGAGVVAERPLETVVLTLKRHLEDQGVDLSGWVGCELWVRRQVMGAGVTTHYDFDIGRKRHFSQERVPYLSSILYLPTRPPTPASSDPNSSHLAPFSLGPTFILDSRHTGTPQTATPTRCEVVWPRAGRYALFDGRLAHGVFPCDGARLAEAGEETSRGREGREGGEDEVGRDGGAGGVGGGVRFTMLVNWWREEKPASPECRPISPDGAQAVQTAASAALRAASRLRPGMLHNYKLSSSARTDGSNASLAVVKTTDPHGIWANGCESKLGGVVATAVPVPCPEYPPPPAHSGLVRLSWRGPESE
jgi:hypothetical protein